MKNALVNASVKAFLSFLMVGFLVSCASVDQSSGKPALAQGATDSEKFDFVVATIRDKGFREVSFDQNDLKDAIEYLLHALDPAYLVLKKPDVETLKERFASNVSFTENGYSTLLLVIDEFSTYSTRVMEQDVLGILAVEPNWTQNSVDVGYSDWALTESDLHSRWEKLVHYDASYYYQLGYSWPEIQDLLSNNYSAMLIRPMFFSDEDKFVLAANSTLELVDSESSYFVNAVSEPYSLSTEGIGLVTSWRGGSITVDKVIVGGPADIEGSTLEGDQIIGIAEEGEEFTWTSRLTLHEVTGLLLGPSGTTVHLKLRRGNLPIDVAVKRGVLNIHNRRISHRVEEVTAQGESYTLGIVSVPGFYVDFQAMRRKDSNYLSASRDMAESVKALQALSVDGIIVDLRGNSGGALQEGNLMAELFIEFGPVVQILQGRDKRVFRDGKRMKSEYYNGPLVVLVDQLSAGSSEIVAGVIQDYNAGIIVGQPTFGHGVLQTLIPMNEGQLKITESELYRVTGISYQINGVTPDVILDVSNHPSNIDVGQRYELNSIPPGEILAVKTANYGKAPRELVENLSQLHNRRVESGRLLKRDDPARQPVDIELYQAKNIAVDYIRALQQAQGSTQ